MNNGDRIKTGVTFELPSKLTGCPLDAMHDAPSIVSPFDERRHAFD